MFMHDFKSFSAAERIVPALACADRTAPVAAGLVAGTLVETGAGWQPVETLKPGDSVQTWDGGLKPVLRLVRTLVAGDGLVTVSGGRFDTCSDLVLPAGQHLLVESDLVEAVAGTPVALVPAGVLAGMPGLGRTPAPAPVEVLTLVFEAEEIVYANSGALLHCPSLAMDPGLAPASNFFAVLTEAQGRTLARLMAGQAEPSGAAPMALAA